MSEEVVVVVKWPESLVEALLGERGWGEATRPYERGLWRRYGDSYAHEIRWAFEREIHDLLMDVLDEERRPPKSRRKR